MKKSKSVALSLAAFAMLSLNGCASISEEECMIGDWYQLGYTDGQEGKRNQSAAYSEDCAEYLVYVDNEEYKKGRSEGLKSYCTYSNGTFVGQNNQEYNHVCPVGLADEFLAGYTPNYNVAKTRASLTSIEGNIEHYKSQLISDSLTANEKKNLLRNLNAAKSDRDRMERTLVVHEIDLALHKVDREIEKINKSLEAEDLSYSRKSQLQNRLTKLYEQRGFYEGLSKTGTTLNSIKNILDMF